MTNTAQDIETALVVAEDAPIGVQLWPTTTPAAAPNFTLESVTVTRTAYNEYVTWTYESGKTRVFGKGEQVACKIS